VIRLEKLYPAIQIPLEIRDTLEEARQWHSLKCSHSPDVITDSSGEDSGSGEK
jgi:hypothetical protein